MTSRPRSVLVGAAATVATVAAVLMPVSALHNTSTPAGPTEIRTAPAAATVAMGLGPCTVTLDGTDWYFDPCLAEGDPLPQEVTDALAEVDRDRQTYPSDSPSPTEPPATDPPSPAP